MTAIAACEAMANAQKRYFSQTHERGRASHYADKLVSDPGNQNELVIWPVTKGRAASPLAGLGDFTKAVVSNTGDHPPLFNGYYYRVLAIPGDFAILAYPAEYRRLRNHDVLSSAGMAPSTKRIWAKNRRRSLVDDGSQTSRGLDSCRVANRNGIAFSITPAESLGSSEIGVHPCSSAANNIFKVLSGETALSL